MSTKCYVAIGTIVVVIILIFSVLVSAIGWSRQEVVLRHTIEQKQIDNKSEFDNMWKQISQVAQVADKDRATLMDVFTEYASARTGQKDQGSLMKWVQEAVPNISPMTDTYKTLMNTITSTRNRWAMRQKELLDLKREHDILIDPGNFPAGWVLSAFMDRKPIEVEIVTSTRTEKSFETGMDDSISVFGK